MCARRIEFAPNVESVIVPVKIPASARNVKQCQLHYVRRNDDLPTGALCVEKLRNDRGMRVGIALPNGYIFPTGREAPAIAWFQMLKQHLRQWMAISPAGRIVRVVDAARDALEGDADPTTAEVLALLDSFRAEAIGELPTGAADRDVVASFYDWLDVTSQAVNRSQESLLFLLRQELQKEIQPEVADLDLDCRPFLEDRGRLLMI